eukprot:15461310-Alexandrium_andersonii.AAC.1
MFVQLGRRFLRSAVHVPAETLHCSRVSIGLPSVAVGTLGWPRRPSAGQHAGESKFIGIARMTLS